LITWKPDYQDFQDIFSNENALRILALLSQYKQQYCAADITKLLDIHISTAKKYLDLFHEHNFIDKQIFPRKAGKPTYFMPKADQITITLDMDRIARSMIEKLEDRSLSNPIIREKAYLEPRITYDVDSKGLIRQLTVKMQTKANRFVKQKVELSQTESQFMKYLPHPTMEFKPFLQVCRRAKLVNYLEIKLLLSFVEKMKKMGIIEEKLSIERK
jgi:predicted transcriptional regulator